MICEWFGTVGEGVYKTKAQELYKSKIPLFKTKTYKSKTSPLHSQDLQKQDLTTP
jgi:hypothetical protein